MVKKILILSILSVCNLSLGLMYVTAQEVPTVTVTTDSSSPASKTLVAEAKNVEVSRIRLTSSATVYLGGVDVDTDVVGGLSNFTNIYVYDITEPTDEVLLGYYPQQSEKPSRITFSQLQITPSLSRTLMIKVSLSSSAAGNIRVGFSGLTFSTYTPPNIAGLPVYGNVITLPGTITFPSPSPSVSGSPAPSPSTIPTKPTPSSLGFTTLTALGLKEGDTVSAAGSSDPDIYIANEWGYKRLFLNPAIFGFYSHLGGFANVKTVAASTRDMMVTSGLFRNCETNDTKVYGVEITGEDAGILHWVNTSGTQAVADDPDFFKKVFCINSAEFNWYSQGSVYTSVNQVPSYSR